MKPTIAHVASALNVSIATVSRALRDLPGVRPDVRAQVKATARSLGVRSRAERVAAPRPTGRSMPRPATGTGIGVLVCLGGRGRFPDAYLRGIGQLCFELGLSATFHLVPEAQAGDLLRPGRMLPAIRDGLFADAILIHRWPEPVVEALSARMHCVAIVNQPATAAVDLVTLDHDGGMQVLVDHLLGLGHRQIGYFGHSTEYRWARQRSSAFQGALEHRGQTVRKGRIIAVDGQALVGDGGSDRWGNELARAITETRAGVTAWVCPNGWSAQALIRHLREAGLDVPRQVTVAAFDASDVQDGITSLDLPLAELGGMAVRLIRDRSGSTARQAVTLIAPCGTIVSGLTAAPPLPSAQRG